MTSLASQPCHDVPTVAKRWSVSERTVRRLIASGKIGVLRIAGTTRIPESEQERFLRESFTPPSTTPRKRTLVSVSRIVAAVARRHQGRPGAGGGG